MSAKLPIIDISDTSPATGAAVLDAAVKHGFLYIDSKGTDFTAEDVEHAFDLAKDFFATERKEKDRYAIQDNRGYSGMHVEFLEPDPAKQKRGDFKEAFNFGEFPSDQPQQPLPPAFPQSSIANFSRTCRQTCIRILDLLALGLEIPDPTWFSSRHSPSAGPSGSTLRMLHYPSLRDSLADEFVEGVDVRAGAHTDYGSMTLLFQREGQPGLEILGQDGGWSSVEVWPAGLERVEGGLPPIVVNMADLLSYWTGGYLRSTMHRVVFPHAEKEGAEERDRYSIAYFCHPAASVELVAVPSPVLEARRETGGVGGEHREKARGMTAQEHLEGRLSETYKYQTRQDKAVEA